VLKHFATRISQMKTPQKPAFPRNIDCFWMREYAGVNNTSDWESARGRELELPGC
jgi:hypothetical protein